MEDVGSARYGPAQLPPWPTISVLSYRNSQRSNHSIFKWIFRNKQIHIPVEGIRLLDAVWKRSPQGPPIYIVEVQCNSRRARGAELDSCCCKQEEPLQRVAWGWCIYNIVESESDPLTRRAVDLFEKEPLKGNSEVHLHTPTKFGEDPSKDLGGDREQTDRQTNRQTDKRCSIYSMI